MAVPLLSHPASTGIGIQLTRLLPVEPVAIVWLFPSDQVTIPFPLPLFWHWAFPQPGPCSAIPRFRARVTEPYVCSSQDLPQRRMAEQGLGCWNPIGWGRALPQLLGCSVSCG